MGAGTRGRGGQGTWPPGARARRAGRKKGRVGALPPQQEWFPTSSCHSPPSPGPLASCPARSRWRSEHLAHGAGDAAPGLSGDPQLTQRSRSTPSPRSPCTPIRLPKPAPPQEKSGAQRGRTHTQSLCHQPTELSNKTVRLPDPAPAGPAGSPRTAPGFLRTPSGSTFKQTPRRPPIPPAPALGPGSGHTEFRAPGSSGTETRAAQEARCHRTPYAGGREAGRGREGKERKIDPSKQPPAGVAAPASTAPAPRPAHARMLAAAAGWPGSWAPRRPAGPRRHLPALQIAVRGLGHRGAPPSAPRL